VKRFFNWILILGACVGAFYLIGLIVPRSQTQGSKTNLQATPENVLQLVVDPQYWTEWHPDFVSVQPRGERSGRALWSVRDELNRSFEIEVAAQEGRVWQGSYALDGTRFTLRFEAIGYGEGSRVQVTRTADTPDPWKRAKRFLWSTPECSAVAILNGIAAYFGEHGQAVTN
jgi:hypothetical protein